MTARDAAGAALDALNSTGIAYMVVGSFSSNFYGVARMTQDADFVLELPEGGMQRLMASLGDGFRLDPQMSFETVTSTTRYVVTTPDEDFKLEFFLLSDDPHDQQRFSRRRPVQLLDRPAYIPTAEDVIIMKLRWCRGGRRKKDLLDAENVLHVQRAALDYAYIEGWCDRHGTRELLDEIRASIPPE